MTRKVRAYTHRETGDSFLPRDVLDALGVPNHVNQGRLIVFAKSATAAQQRCAALRLPGIRSTRDLRIATGNDVDALVANEANQDDAAYALSSGEGSAVVGLYSLMADDYAETGNRYRQAERIGEIIRDANGRCRFVPDDAPEPVVTDAMLDAARAVFANHFPSAIPTVGHVDAGIRAMIVAALQARES